MGVVLAFEQSNDFLIRFCTNDKNNHETSIERRQLYFQSIGIVMKGIQRVYTMVPSGDTSQVMSLSIMEGV